MSVLRSLLRAAAAFTVGTAATAAVPFSPVPPQLPADLAAIPPDHFYGMRPATIGCVLVAAQRQGVPVNVLLAIASVEGGRNGHQVGNTNTSTDLGHFQINTTHWSASGVFARYPSITQQAVTWRGCYNAELAAWLLRSALEGPEQDFWTRAANYHSRTPSFNATYRSKLIPLSRRWADWLQTQNLQLSVSHR